MIEPANIILENEKILLSGDWTLQGIEGLSEERLLQTFPASSSIQIDGSQIKNLDIAGVYLIDKFKNQLLKTKNTAALVGLSSQQQRLFDRILAVQSTIKHPPSPKKLNFFARIGFFIVNKISEFIDWMNYIGEFTLTSLKLISKPAAIPWKSILSVIDITGFRALGIIGFLSFLIGIVLTYQVGVQLQYYGANVFIINFLGIGIFREFGPLLAAIILAGRTSSAYAAQIGLMKANEELDALKTMGISPIELLIFPRIIGLIIAMPLLVVWSDICGLIGGMIMSKLALSVNFHTFINQFPRVITLTTFLIGLVKAPFFAIIIAGVGCYHGLKVSGSATSIGEHTTKSVVLAIFLIIIADAIFSIVLSYFGV